MSRETGNALIVFLKYPEAGRVKTRLGKEIGNRRAAEFYYETANFVASYFSGSLKWETFFFYTPWERKKEVLQWLGGYEAVFFAQEEGSLGQRMCRAFGECFSLGFRNVVIIGTDCVMITKEDVETSFSLLSGGDFEAVIGPATDGGYYLLGLSRQTDFLFQNITWSSSGVFEETRKRLQKSGLRHVVMRELADIDTKVDIRIEDIMTRDPQLAYRLEKVLSNEQETSAEKASEGSPI